MLKKTTILISLLAVFILILTLISLLSKAHNHQEKKHELRISFIHKVGTVKMELGETYLNYFNEEYTIRTFKYYISNIVFEKVGGEKVAFTNSHLVDEADSTTKSFSLPVPKSRYNTLSFLIGVDSIFNVSGTQTGDLDPVKGMFWTWNSGYITAKLEASSPVSTATNNNVSYHIGGYKAPMQTARLVTLNLGDSAEFINEIVIEADANKWFMGKHDLKIAENPACTTPGKLAVKFADNYAQMFIPIAIR